MNTGSVLAQFTLTLSTAVNEPVSVDWFTSDGTAKAGVDYAANKGTAYFAPGETAKTVDILVYGRAVGSEDRSFFVEMLPPANAILGASIGECIIHVDTTGSTPVTQIIIPTGPRGPIGKSSYQSYLDTTTDNPPKTEAEWVQSLKGNPAEIAQEVAPLLDVGGTVLTAADTESLSKPDKTTVKDLARRLAYAGRTRIATVTLADGDNTIAPSNLSGDIVDFYALDMVPRVLHNGVFTEHEWSLNADGTMTIKAAQAGDVLYVTQYDLVSEYGTKSLVAATIATIMDSLKSGDGSQLGYQLGTGSTHRTMREKAAERVSLWDFHCDNDGKLIAPGTTVDSRPYIQKAIDTLYAAGGGTLIIPAGTTFYLASYGVNEKIGNYAGIIHWRSRVNIHFEAGATLKLTDYFNEKGYCVICGFDGNDPMTAGDLRDATISGNGTIHCGDNNVQPIGSRLAYAIGTGKSYNVRIQDIHITGGDLTWAATVGWNGFGSNSVVDGVTVTEIKRSDIDRNVDQTLFYIGCPYSGVRNCYMSPAQSGLAQRITCAVELHQGFTFCENNYIEGCVRGLYVVQHSQEIAGHGPRMTNVRVCNNTAVITGQFCTIGAEKIYAETSITDVIVANNQVTIVDFNPIPGLPPIAMIGRNFVSSDVWTNAPPDSETSRVLITDNVFFCPNNLAKSAFFYFTISTRGWVFSGNHMDCQQAVVGTGAGSTTVELRDLIWDETNTFGTSWMGKRASNPNLFEFYVAAMIRCKFEVKLSYEDATIANVIYVQPACSVSYSALRVAPDYVKSPTNGLGIGNGAKTVGTNHLSYPADVSMSCYNTTGPVTCFSTDTSYAWVMHAKSLSRGIDDATFTPPSSLVSKVNGQLIGVGASEGAATRSWSQRFLLEGGRS